MAWGIWMWKERRGGADRDARDAGLGEERCRSERNARIWCREGFRSGGLDLVSTRDTDLIPRFWC